MKIAILGAAGVRTPLIVEAIARRQDRIGIEELALFDIDGERLELIGSLTALNEDSGRVRFRITRTTRVEEALSGADFVITTFRVGGIESRAIDEKVPLELGVLGQETTGPGGFAMAVRTIPVLLEYIDEMRSACPSAWLINFANPAGIITEAALQEGGWRRAVGICDAPAGMGRVAAALLGVRTDQIYLDYFGLNHLGWLRAVIQGGQDRLPQLIEMVKKAGGIEILPFEPRLIDSLGMLPNEYLYYYYYSDQAVRNILSSEECRAEQIADLNRRLFGELSRLNAQGNLEAMQAAYRSYLDERSETYMKRETGRQIMTDQVNKQIAQALNGEGYAGVALDLIEGLVGRKPRTMVLNISNRGAVHDMADEDVVELPAFVGQDLIHPMAVGVIPDHCLGLMKQVKAYERLTIAAAVEKSYQKAWLALTTHPLVSDSRKASAILDGYIQRHAGYFPELK